MNERNYHTPTVGAPIPCVPGCRICQLLDRDGPHYQAGYRRMFFPGEFPAEQPTANPMPSPPGILQKAVNLTRATIEHVRAGRPILPAAESDARLAICRSCDRLDAANQSCRLCGCNMPVKVTWAEQSCPEGRWLAADPG